MHFQDKQSGFTLMEIVVSTTIFVTTVVLMLGLFTDVLRINREVEGLRQATQGTRNFTESLVREIRNGTIDYASTDARCAAINYAGVLNQSLGLVNSNGESLCFYLNTAEQALYVSKDTTSGFIDQPITPAGFTIEPTTFQFLVRPITDPSPSSPPYPGVQPFVSIIGEFKVSTGATSDDVVSIPYQTTISTDSYDIPHE